VNLTGAELLGITRTKLINRGFGHFVVPSDFNLWNDHLLLNLLLKDGKKQSCELRLKCEDGSTTFVRLDSVRMEIIDGTLQVRTAVSDITELTRVEEERIQLIAREHEANAEAEAARKLDRMKSMFIASTSHELRTPLNSIIGFTSLILDGTSGELTPDQKEQLMIVHSSGKHLLALINDIIDSSKIDAEKIDLHVSEFDLRQMVDEAVLTLFVNIKEKGLKISVEVEDITMKTDRLRLLQCVINLISNAVKYTEKGSIKLIAKTKENIVYISVIDTGIGIKTEDITKLFGSFVRLQTLLTAKTSGTGLGLFLVKKLAKDFLGGDVEVESEFGKGSKFTLSVLVELERKV
jgi:PAS domain S-box-containing protein